MKKLFLLFAATMFATTAQAKKSIEDLQTDISETHGIDIRRVQGNRGDSWDVNDTMFRYFLDNFIVEAERQNLTVYGNKRFIPAQFSLKVFPENWSLTDSGVSYFGADIGFYYRTIRTGHKSAKAAVQFIISHFPLEDTPEAFELALRNRAIRTAIMDIVRELDSKGVEVTSYNFSVSLGGGLDSENDIGYETQESLLQGLINLLADVNSGKEFRSKVNVTSLPWPYRDEGDISFNRIFRSDESQTQTKISEYMERLRAKAQ